jgi:molybdopterin/thiamine biosynthesis adenylyltransferase
VIVNQRQLQRYSRHILLPQIDVSGQERLLAARVLIAGLGGLGSPAALYLAGSGIGALVLWDDDVVELANLQRQIIHTDADLGRPKVVSARDKLLTLNPDVRVEARFARLAGDALEDAVAGVDAVVDATDNFATRFALNAACVKHRVPLISGAAVRFQGQVCVFPLQRPGGPCYRCLFQDDDQTGETCGDQGVLAPLVGIIGSVQATEAVKLLAGLPCPGGRLLLLDGLTMQWRSVAFSRDRHCPVCGSNDGQASGVSTDIQQTTARASLR